MDAADNTSLNVANTDPDLLLQNDVNMIDDNSVHVGIVTNNGLKQELKAFKVTGKINYEDKVEDLTDAAASVS